MGFLDTYIASVLINIPRRLSAMPSTQIHNFLEMDMTLPPEAAHPNVSRFESELSEVEDTILMAT